MIRWPHITGILAGAILGAGLLRLAGGDARDQASGSILSECDGHLRDLVIQYECSAREVSLPVYRQLLPRLEPEVTVRVVCPDKQAFDELRAAVGEVRCLLKPVLIGHSITTWSRDRWVALVPEKKGRPSTLLYPRGEAAQEVWPARAGDRRVAADLAAVSKSSTLARRSSLYFDGGDFLSDADNVIVIPRVLQRNLQHTVANREVLLSILSAEFHRRVILLDEAPDHHAAMFMASVGHRTMLVGDPRLGGKLMSLPNDGPVSGLPAEADFSEATQHLFDAVAARCEAAGYKVIRIPTLLSTDGRTYFTYVNALIDERPGGRVVYLPCYRGQEVMNQAAARIWEGQGYEVRPIDCTSTYRHGGCLHCLVNVAARETVLEPRAYTAAK